MSNFKISQNGINLIRSFEGCSLTAYKCPAGVWTIGWGNTIYPNGQKVSPKDVITQQRADEINLFIIDLFVKDVNSLVKSDINQNQFDALVDFAYNVGSDIDIDIIPEGLGDSTLLKLVNANPSNIVIESEFMKWNKSGGKPLPGLTRRRKADADLYFKPII